MTRQDLLNRLAQMAQRGEDMSFPVIVRVKRTVPDNRRCNGVRREELFADVTFACDGRMGFTGDSNGYGELHAHTFNDWRGSWKS